MFRRIVIGCFLLHWGWSVQTLVDEQLGVMTVYSRTQQLIIASFYLEVDQVQELLQSGVDVNSKMGNHDIKLFQDKWSLGWPNSSSGWTPLLAAANSFSKPQPGQETENTSEALERAQVAKASIPQGKVEKRNRRRLEIIKLLVQAGAELDVDDGYGATALFDLLCIKDFDSAKYLIQQGADVNAAVGVYIDLPTLGTPLHMAVWNAGVVKMMLERGANPHATNSREETPLDKALFYRRNYKEKKLWDITQKLIREKEKLGEQDQKKRAELEKEIIRVVEWK